MASITIQTTVVQQEWKWGGTTATMRVYANQSFVTSTDVPVLTGTYKTVNCTVAGTVLTIPSFVLDSTTDSTVQNGTYTAIFYDHTGARRDTMLSQFQLPTSLGVSISWANLIAYNRTVRLTFLVPTTYTDDQINELLTTQQPIVDASALNNGKNFLDVDPVNASIPIAVGANSPVYLAVQDSIYLDAVYANDLSAAITAIGADRVNLKITNAVAVTGNTTVPSNILLTFEGEGKVTVSGGVTLTISSMTDPGSRQVFFGAGNTVFAKNAVPHFNLTWWAGVSNGSSVQLAFSNAVTSLTNNLGGKLFIPAGVWQMTGDLALPNGTIIEGVGSHPDAGQTSVVKLTANNVSIFKAAEAFRNIVLRDVVLDCGTATGAKCFSISGTNPNSCFGLGFFNVSFHNGTYGLYCNSTAADWEMENIRVSHCQFTGQTIACYRVNSVNGSALFDENLFNCGNGVDAFLLESCGKLVSLNNTILGPNLVPASGGTCYNVTAQQAGLVIIGGQDEAMVDYLTVDVSDSTYPITLIGNIVQSYININESCVINSTGNRYHADSWLPAPASAARIFASNDHILDSDLNGNSPVPQVYGDFTASNSIICKNESPVDTNFVYQMPAKFWSPLPLDGSPTTPVTTIAHYTIASENKILARWGRTDIAGVPDFYYDWYRRHDTLSPTTYLGGRLTLEGNQTATPGAVGFDFLNGDMSAVNFRGAVVSPAQITGNQNNYNPGSVAQNIRLSTDISRNITGMTTDYPQRAGDWRTITNVGAFNIVLVHDATSTAANRFYNASGADITLTPNQMAFLVYDGVISRWRVSVPQQLDATLTALSGVVAAADKLPYFNGTDTATVTDLTAAGRALLDDANNVDQMVTLGMNATAAEINQFNDVSGYSEVITAAGALSVTKKYSKISITGATYDVTLAAPDATMLGQTKVIEMTVNTGPTTTVNLTPLTNLVRDGAAVTNCAFNAVGETLLLVALTDKWMVVQSYGVVFS